MEGYGKLFLSTGQESEREFTLAKSTISLGRGTINDITLPDPKISRQHARLIRDASGIRIEDLGSLNGTRVNGQTTQRAPLALGDVIELGDSRLRLGPYSLPAAAEGTIIDAPRIDSEAELEATLADSALEVSLADTSLPRLAIHTPTRTWEVQLLGEMSIGRSATSDIVLDYPRASRYHARVRPVGNDWVFEDLGSTNGTWFGGERIEERRLAVGDTLTIGQAQLVFKAPVVDQELTLADEAPSRRIRRKPIVFVPGLMGSELWRGDQMLWPNVRRLFADPGLFKLPAAADLDPRHLTREVVVVPNLVKMDQYNRLVDFLVEELGYRSGDDLLEFPYDWRQDVRVSAGKLSQAIGKWREEQGHARVTIIAHSLGCMVSRYFVERLDGQAQIERLILMGGPLHGTPKMFLALLLGKGLLPFGMLSDQIRATVATFPSCYQVVPGYGAWSTRPARRSIWPPTRAGSGRAMKTPGGRPARSWPGLEPRARRPSCRFSAMDMRTATQVRVTRDRAGPLAGDSDRPDRALGTGLFLRRAPCLPGVPFIRCSSSTARSSPTTMSRCASGWSWWNGEPDRPHDWASTRSTL